MPDAVKAREKRRRKLLEEARAVKDALATFANHNEASKELLLPEGFHSLADRDDPFLQSQITVYHNSVLREFALKINGRLLGPFKKHELQCLRDCLRNDLDI